MNAFFFLQEAKGADLDFLWELTTWCGISMGSVRKLRLC